MNTPVSNSNFRSHERLSNSGQYYSSSARHTSFPVKMIYILLWAICHFTFYIVQQLAEIFAPLCLVIGLLWKLLPTITSSAMKVIASSDFQTSDLMKHANTLIPTSVSVAGYHLTAGKLITDGFVLLILTGFCATLTAYLGRKL